MLSVTCIYHHSRFQVSCCFIFNCFLDTYTFLWIFKILLIQAKMNRCVQLIISIRMSLASLVKWNFSMLLSALSFCLFFSPKVHNTFLLLYTIFPINRRIRTIILKCYLKVLSDFSTYLSNNSLYIFNKYFPMCKKRMCLTLSIQFILL